MCSLCCFISSTSIDALRARLKIRDWPFTSYFTPIIITRIHQVRHLITINLSHLQSTLSYYYKIIVHFLWALKCNVPRTQAFKTLMPLFLEEWEFDLGSFLLAIPLFGSFLFFEIASWLLLFINPLRSSFPLYFSDHFFLIRSPCPPSKHSVI